MARISWCVFLQEKYSLWFFLCNRRNPIHFSLVLLHATCSTMKNVTFSLHETAQISRSRHGKSVFSLYPYWIDKLKLRFQHVTGKALQFLPSGAKARLCLLPLVTQCLDKRLSNLPLCCFPRSWAVAFCHDLSRMLSLKVQTLTSLSTSHLQSAPISPSRARRRDCVCCALMIDRATMSSSALKSKPCGSCRW